AAPTRALNARLLRRQVARWAQHPGPRALWTYTPYTYGLEHLADATVYHLVDLLHENPGVHAARLLAAERALARTAGLAIGTSAAIAAHLERQGFAPVLSLPNVADVDVFARAAAERTAPREPVAVFAGTLAAHKVDLPLLAHLAHRLRGRAQLRLVGPLAPGTAGAPGWSELLAAGAQVLPAVGPRELAAQLAGAAVGLVPYRVTPLTEGVSPLKTYEYLAAGLAVVSTPLPAVSALPGAVWVEDGPQRFAERVLDLLARADPQLPARCRAAAAGHDWSRRGHRLREVLGDLLPA
ncbi:glycosyltransferase, partial [Kineococcus indalonis]|uniref:glycosyltransferase n=1 Tax=Kineococcus indalonis TaxID=2696566 RepID=UPI00141328C4